MVIGTSVDFTLLELLGSSPNSSVSPHPLDISIPPHCPRRCLLWISPRPLRPPEAHPLPSKHSATAARLNDSTAQPATRSPQYRARTMPHKAPRVPSRPIRSLSTRATDRSTSSRQSLASHPTRACRPESGRSTNTFAESVSAFSHRLPRRSAQPLALPDKRR